MKKYIAALLIALSADTLNTSFYLTKGYIREKNPLFDMPILYFGVTGLVLIKIVWTAICLSVMIIGINYALKIKYITSEKEEIYYAFIPLSYSLIYI